MIEVIVGVLVIVAMSDAGRPYATWFLIAVALTAYETVSVAVTGTTVGKSICNLRVLELDRSAGVSWATALRRGSVMGSLLALGAPIPGLLASVGMSPLHRGVHDRLSGTYVVDRRVASAVHRINLATIAEMELAANPTRWGWGAPLSSRRRGRLHRLDDAPLLVVATLGLALVAAFGHSLGNVLALTTGPWVICFLVDETRRVARSGRTAGHRRFGMVILDTRTGEPPGLGRSFVRALCLVTALYVPALGFALSWWVPVLAWTAVLLPDVLCLVLREDHRALHDLLARTVVVVDPTLDAEAQRQAALAVDIPRSEGLGAPGPGVATASGPRP